jgi:hypothetical protein
MNILGFSAEAGLYKTKSCYYGANGSGIANHSRSIIPQLRICSSQCPVFNIFAGLVCCVKTCTTCVTRANGNVECTVDTSYSGNACGTATTVYTF